MRLVSRTALCSGNKVVTGQKCSDAAARRYINAGAAGCGKLSLALARATGLIPPRSYPPKPTTEANRLETSDARNSRSRRGFPSALRTGQGLVDPARRFRRQRSRTVQDRFVLAVFRPAAQGRPGALLQGQHVR